MNNRSESSFKMRAIAGGLIVLSSGAKWRAFSLGHSGLVQELTFEKARLRRTASAEPAHPREGLTAVIPPRAKHQSSAFLASHGFQVPESRVVTLKRFRTVLNAMTYVGAQVVIKPNSGTKGNGVTVCPQTYVEFALGLFRALVLGKGRALLEEFVPGVEVRVTATKNRLIGAFIKTPASLVGNGQHTIEELIEKKNAVREELPGTSGESRSIRVGRALKKELRSQNLSLQSVLPVGHQIFVSKLANVHWGADTEEVSALISDSLQSEFSRICALYPQFEFLGLDIRVASATELTKDGAGFVVMEINEKPGILGHHYPVKGPRRDAVMEIFESVGLEGTFDLTQSIQSWFLVVPAIEGFEEEGDQWLEVKGPGGAQSKAWLTYYFKGNFEEFADAYQSLDLKFEHLVFRAGENGASVTLDENGVPRGVDIQQLNELMGPVGRTRGTRANNRRLKEKAKTVIRNLLS